MAWICCACARAEGTRNSTYRIKALIADLNGLNFLPRQMPHECLIMPFTRDGVDLLRLCQGRGHAELNIPNKGLDCGESSVARGRTITSLFLNVGEEVEN